MVCPKQQIVGRCALDPWLDYWTIWFLSPVSALNIKKSSTATKGSKCQTLASLLSFLTRLPGEAFKPVQVAPHGPKTACRPISAKSGRSGASISHWEVPICRQVRILNSNDVNRNPKRLIYPVGVLEDLWGSYFLFVTVNIVCSSTKVVSPPHLSICVLRLYSLS